METLAAVAALEAKGGGACERHHGKVASSRSDADLAKEAARSRLDEAMAELQEKQKSELAEYAPSNPQMPLLRPPNVPGLRL